MKPLEFKIEEKENMILITFFYEKGKSKSLILSNNSKDEFEAFTGLKVGNHYSIADIYGYQVVDDRKGL